MLCKALYCVHFFVTLLQAYSYENIYGPLYGDEWMVMAGEDGFPYYMDFSEPNETGTEPRFYSGNPYFYLYTRNNPQDPEELSLTKHRPTSSEYFNASNDVKTITHGWLSSGNTQWIIDLKDAYLRTYDINVIAVDWSEMSKNPVYPWSALATKHVGRKVAEMIDSLRDNYGVGGERVHLLGHSLGAQVMGYAGSFSAQNISRITGLDPARPLFERPDAGAARRLDAGDAVFVDVLHSCGGLLGYGRSHGHADFYPNGGAAAQPGCEGVQHALEACSHGRSYEFFMESIESTVGFVAYRCGSQEEYQEGCRDDPNLMGEFADRSLHGDFYLDTNSEPKFAKGAEETRED